MSIEATGYKQSLKSNKNDTHMQGSMNRRVDMALLDIMTTELCELEERLARSVGTDQEAKAKAALTAAVKKMNRVLEGMPDGTEDDLGIVVAEGGIMKVVEKHSLNNN